MIKIDNLHTSNVWDKTSIANHTQFKSGNTFQTNKRSWSHHELFNFILNRR